MKENKFPAVFGGLMAVGVLGLGYFAFSSWSSQKTATAEYDKTSRTVTGLRSSTLFPDDANLAQKIELVDSYEASVEALQEKLLAPQRALKPVSEQEFPRILLSAYEKTAAAAAAAKVALPEGFYFGMEGYKNGPPPPAASSVLEWELDGINFLTNILIDEGVDSLDRIARDPIPEESGDFGKEVEEKKSTNKRKPAPKAAVAVSGDKLPYEPDRVMDTYRFTVDFTADHSSLVSVLNRIANEKSFFYWTRSMRIENEKKIGPPKGVPFTPVPVEPTIVPAGAEVVPEPDPEDPAEDPAADPAAAAIDATVAESAAPADSDAMIDVQEILGTEKVRASLVIDLVRFKDKGAEGDDANSEK